MFGVLFKRAIIFIIFAELISLCVFLLPQFMPVAFFAILLLVIALTTKRLEYGIIILFAELFIGSKGYLFFFEYEEITISIRIALWLVVMSVWTGKIIINLINKTLGPSPMGSSRRCAPQDDNAIKSIIKKDSFLIYFFIIFIFIAWGLVNGLFNNNEFPNIFFDFNGWLFFALLFPLYFLTVNNTPRRSTPPRPKCQMPIVVGGPT